MIEGVKIKPLKLLEDDRGKLMEMLRADDEIFNKFGQVYITVCNKGVAKGWHYHKIQTDNFICVSGKALVVLCDTREGSSTFGQAEEYILESPTSCEGKPFLLQIPPHLMHGFTAHNCDSASIVNLPTEMYNYDTPDEYRFPWNSEKINYKWPEHITRGG